MCGIIYKATNLVNGKIYIGQTTRNFKLRISEHIRKSKSGEYKSAFAQAIRKYGEDNFNWCIIDESNTIDELDDKEEFWIEYYKTYRGKNGHGYNMTIGGNGAKGLQISEATRIKMKTSHMGKTHSKEIRLKISLSNKGRMSGKNHPMYGKKFSEERKDKISIALIGRAISEETRKKISESHKGKTLSIEHIENLKKAQSGEGNGMYGKKHSNETRNKISKANKGRLSGVNNPSARCIVQLSKDGKFIRKYTTGSEGAKSVNGDLSAIIKCCKRKQKSAHGFKWMYEEDYNV